MTTPSTPSRPYHQPPPPAARSSGVAAADLTAAIVGLVLYAALLVLASGAGLFLGFLSDGCGAPGACDGSLMGLGIVMAMLGTWVPYVAALAGVVVQAARNRRTWWIPPAAAVLSAGVFLLGVGLAAAGGPHG